MDTFLRKLTKVLLIELVVILLALLAPWVTYSLFFLIPAPSNTGLGAIGAILGVWMVVVTVIIIGSALIAGRWIKDTRGAKLVYSLLTAFASILIIILISNRA